MPITPETNLNLEEVQFVEQPSFTWHKDPNTKRISGNADGLRAIQQTVEAIFNIERFQWQIYTPYTGISWNGLIGEDPGYVASELQRRVKEALSVDERVLGIENFKCSMLGETLTAEMTVNTVFGSFSQILEVNLT